MNRPCVIGAPTVSGYPRFNSLVHGLGVYVVAPGNTGDGGDLDAAPPPPPAPPPPSPWPWILGAVGVVWLLGKMS